MTRVAKQTLLSFANKVIEDGEKALKTEFATMNYHWVRPEPFGQFVASFKHLLQMLGSFGDPWRDSFEDLKGYSTECARLLGAARAIEYTIANDLMMQVESLVMAEAFTDLLEQADHLESGGFHVAAGVLGRAVLEEHLRKLCDREKAMPAKAKPTMSDYYSELDKAKFITRVTRMQIEAMAAIGNAAAHAKPVTEAEIQKLLRDVRGFLVEQPL